MDFKSKKMPMSHHSFQMPIARRLLLLGLLSIFLLGSTPVIIGDGFIQSEPKRFVMLDDGLIYLWED